MTAIATPWSPAVRRMGARVILIAGAYGAAAVVILLVILLLRRAVSPDQLRGVLGVFFITVLAAGLEPATVKAQLLRGGADDVPVTAYLGASLVKALTAAPVLALVWTLADPRMDPWAFLWTPLIAMAGFSTTDLRVLLDARGRHAGAIALKQGSLAGGLAMLAGLTVAGVPLVWAIGISALARLAVVAAAAVAMSRGGLRQGAWPAVLGLLTAPRWIDLAAASAIAAAGGSIDRVLALRFLPAAVFGAYLLLYETFSRFWLLPYLLTPILFARHAAGREAGAFIRGAWLSTLAAGAMFLMGVTGVMVLAPELPRRFLGMSFGLATLAFAAAVVIGAFTQLRVAQLQATGQARRVTLALGLGAGAAALIFFLFVMHWGASGLLWAWLVKSGVEFLATLVGGRPDLRPQRL